MLSLAGNPPALTLRGDVDRLVIVAPHPDDETLATGLLLAVAAERGVPTVVLAVTDGEAAYPHVVADDLAAIRRDEQIAALSELGHHDVIRRLGIADGFIERASSQLEDAIADHVTSESLLVAPSACDWHPDHEACGRAARRAAARAGCELWSSLFWAHHHPDRLLASSPEIRELLGDRSHAERRMRALRHHHSQLHADDTAPILHDGLLGHLASPTELYVVEVER